MKTKKTRVRLPEGWTLEDVEELRKHYDNQSDEEAAAEIDAAREIDEVVMIVPRKLVAQVRKLIAQNERVKSPHAKTRRVA